MIKNSHIGVVVIGRNEGSRLVSCLTSIPKDVEKIVYVDSGSSDDSLAQAEKLGTQTILLDMSIPFTAARARNTGFRKLIDGSDLDYVQFVDGDCILQPDWFDAAVQFLNAQPNAAVACGRRREKFPNQSVFNRLCDQEWDTPIGKTDACGGDAMMRVEAFEKIGGYRDTMIAGEEPELCVRLRSEGWEIWRLDQEMTLHDAAITRIGQWWKRARRSGHAFAEGAALHGTGPQRHSVGPVRRIMIWGVVIPLLVLIAALFISPWALLGFLIYPLQVARIASRFKPTKRQAWEYAFFLVLGNFPEAVGVLEYHCRKIQGRPTGLIEYK